MSRDDDVPLHDTANAVSDVLNGHTFGHAFAALGMVMCEMLRTVPQDNRPDLLTSWIGTLSRAMRIVDEPPSRELH